MMQEIREIFRFIEHDLRAGMAIIFGCLILILAACAMDMWTGIDAAKANKEPIRSRPLRKTGIKIVDYYRFIACLLLIDLLGVCFTWYDKPYGVIIGTAGVLIVEGWSVVENLRKKKSHAADAADLAKKIVECVANDEAEKIIKAIKETYESEQKTNRSH